MTAHTLRRDGLPTKGDLELRIEITAAVSVAASVLPDAGPWREHRP